MRSSAFALSAAFVLAFLSTARADIAGDCAAWRKAHGVREALPTVCLAENDKLEPPLFDNIGATARELYLGDPDIQKYFNQGLRFFYAANPREAYRAFRYAADLGNKRGKPCGYCYWGIGAALSVAPGSFLPPEPDRLAARAALLNALTIFKPEQVDGRGLVNALLTRTEDCKPEDRCDQKREKEYYAFVKPLVTRSIPDSEVAVLYADAALATTRLERLEDARKELKRAMAAPFGVNNTGLVAWYLLVMEASGLYGDAEPVADKLRTMAPGAGYLLHLPSRTYYLLGKLAKAQAANTEAADADLNYFNDPRNPIGHPSGDAYRYGAYLHTRHFLIAAALQNGNKEAVEVYAGKLLAALPREADAYGRDFHLAMYLLGRTPVATPEQIRLFYKPVADKQPLANIAYYFAQTRADYWTGETESPNLKLLDEAVSAYPDKTKCPDEFNDFPTERCLVEMMSDLAHAYEAAAKKNWKAALTKAQTAAEIQRRMRDGLPGVWVLPASQTLASFYIQAALGEPTPPQDYLKKAQELLYGTLNTVPSNGWAYFGLWQVALHIKDGKPADAEKAFRAQWVGAPPKLDHL
ncbi:MAG TPA: hypothetical protein VG889_13210 [Rhizomicrobium sp.]|nr:hypothetical protein [Rhizomicrobium sp.]